MAIEKILNGENGEFLGKYHRINEVILDFDNNQIHVALHHYADETYRDDEKKQLKDIKALKNKDNDLNPKSLAALEIISKHIKSSRYTFDFDGNNFAIKDIYAKLSKLDIFKDSKAK